MWNGLIAAQGQPQSVCGEQLYQTLLVFLQFYSPFSIFITINILIISFTLSDSPSH